MAAQILTFETPPSLAPIFARVALPRKKSSASLPDVEAQLNGLSIDRSDLLAYQRVCGFAGEDRLPQTYPHVLGFGLQASIMARPDFPIPMLGLVHVENVITSHQVLTSDDVLDVVVRPEALRPHSKGRTVDLVTEVSVGGELAWEGRSTYLARGKGSEEAAAGVSPPPMPEGFPVAQWALGKDLGRRYAAVSGDINPIHLHPLSAKALGFPSAIAHGMWSYARVLAALGARAAGPGTSRVWFRKPILLPSRVDLVLDTSANPLVAGLRSSRKTSVEHLLLTWEPADVR